MRGLLRSHPSGLLQVDHDFAKRGTGLARPPQCLGRLVEGVGLEHLGIDLPGATRLATAGTPHRAGQQEAAYSVTRGPSHAWPNGYLLMGRS
jgi:hypothetical protein